MGAEELAPSLAAKLEGLRADLAARGTTLLAFSGGVDSSLVLQIAHEVLGDRLTALTSVSPTNPEHDTSHAIAFARALGVRHLVVASNELEVPGYSANPANRCYLCKTRLYEICAAEARRRAIASIVDGVNADDLVDYRPGLRAAAERGVGHPLVDAAIGKEDVRRLSRALGLASWDRPASPCLSSRFPYGTASTAEGLRMVAAAEDGLRALGFRTLRVRFHGALARVEIDAAEQPRLVDQALRARALAAVRQAGFARVEIDPAGFRSGSLNLGLTASVHRS